MQTAFVNKREWWHRNSMPWESKDIITYAFDVWLTSSFVFVCRVLNRWIWLDSAFEASQQVKWKWSEVKIIAIVIRWRLCQCGGEFDAFYTTVLANLWNCSDGFNTGNYTCHFKSQTEVCPCTVFKELFHLVEEWFLERTLVCPNQSVKEN